jgi:hypothetical protein
MKIHNLPYVLYRFIILGFSYCSIVFLFGRYVVYNTPSRGDNMGLGIICVSIPLALIATEVVFALAARFIFIRKRKEVVYYDMERFDE